VKKTQLQPFLEGLYNQYNQAAFVSPDPLQFLSSYSQIQDREIVGLIASSLAYGQVKIILNNVSQVLKLLGKYPYKTLLEKDDFWFKNQLQNFRHRWHSGKDIVEFLKAIRSLLQSYGSLDLAMKDCLKNQKGDVIQAIDDWVDRLRAGGDFRPNLLSKPSDGSACKRLMLYFRWMVRSDQVDPGGWTSLKPSQLFVPLDTHMFEMARRLKLTRRNQANWKTVEEISRAFARLVPDDPIRYDFVLTRPGIWRDGELKKKIQKLDCFRLTPSQRRFSISRIPSR